MGHCLTMSSQSQNESQQQESSTWNQMYFYSTILCGGDLLELIGQVEHNFHIYRGHRDEYNNVRTITIYIVTIFNM